MTQDTAQMPLDERGLEVAYSAGRDYVMEMDDRTKQMLRVSIRAYLQTAAADVSGMVERLRTGENHLMRLLAPSLFQVAKDISEAATTLQTLSASNAALEAENKRLRAVLNSIKCDANARLVSDIEVMTIVIEKAFRRIREEATAALSAPKGGQDE